MAITDAPKIVTARLGYDDSHTLERYLATGGYEGLRKALTMTPEAVAARGRHGQPARPGRRRLPGRAQVVDAAQEPGDLPGDQRRRERAGHLQGPPAHRARPAPDHRGRAHRRLRAAGHPGLHLPAGRVRPRARADAGRAQRRLRPRRGRAPTSSARASRVDVVVHPGAGAYICGEETALLESLEGKRGFPRIKPPFFPAAIGLYGEPTVVNNVETMSNLPWIVHQRRRRLRRPRARAARPGTRLFALAGHVRNPGIYELEMVKTTFRDLIYAPVLGGGIPDGRARSRPSSPAACRPRGSAPTRSTCRSARTRWATAGSMLGSGSVVVMDRPHLRGAGRLAHHQVLRPRVVRPVHARAARDRAGSSGSCTASRTATGARRTSTCSSTLCDNISPGLAWPPQQTTICVLGPVHPVVHRLGHPHVPRRVPRAHQGRGVSL